MENKRRRADGQGCEDCPACYNLVQDAVNQHRKELKELDDVSLEINRSASRLQDAQKTTSNNRGVS